MLDLPPTHDAGSSPARFYFLGAGIPIAKPTYLPTIQHPGRWAPTSYKWSYKPYKWPYNWVTGVITPISGVITILITGRGAHLVGGRFINGVTPFFLRGVGHQLMVN